VSYFFKEIHILLIGKFGTFVINFEVREVFWYHLDNYSDWRRTRIYTRIYSGAFKGSLRC